MRFVQIKFVVLALLIEIISGAVGEVYEKRSTNDDLLEFVESSTQYQMPRESQISPNDRRWVAKGNLAKALNLVEIESIHLPLDINIIPLGFNGNGRLGVKLDRNDLLSWFSHLENSSVQTVIESFSPEQGSDKSLHETNVTDKSAAEISYRYHYHLVDVDARVTDVITHLMSSNSRSVNAQIGQPAHLQVDADSISDALDQLVAHLGLHTGYTIFILSPELDWTKGKIKESLDQDINLDFDEPANQSEHTALYGYRIGFSNDEIEIVISDDALRRSLNMNDEDWSKGHIETKGTTTKGENIVPPRADHGVSLIDKRKETKAWAEAILFAPSPGDSTLSDYINKLKVQAPEVLREVVVNEYAQQDCLVDNWMGRKRSVFIDLSAGPFTWGPVVGGEGVRTNTSRPSASTFASFAMESAGLKVGDPTQDDEDYYAPALTNWEDVEKEKQDILKQLESPECRKRMTPRCQEWKRKLQDIEAFESHQSGENTYSGPHAYSYYSDGHTSGHDSALETSHFLSHLSATLSATIRHVFTPSVGVTAGYSTRIAFHIYVLSNHQTYDPLGDGFLHRIKIALDQLRLPEQTFSYAIHKLSMDDDPLLAMAFTSSLRSAVIPTLHHDGRFSAIKRLYLDSRVLETKLTNLHNFESTKSAYSTGARDIPIFLFSIDSALPVFVDKRYQAKALSSMVVAVQSNQHLWESHLSCNNRPIYWNLRDPVRSIVSSASHVLGGLLPAHLTYSSAHERIAQDWTWSVGFSPLSSTSSGMQFSQIHRDILQRNYVVSALRKATHSLNSAIKRLENVRTTLANEPLTGFDDDSGVLMHSAASDRSRSIPSLSPFNVGLGDDKIVLSEKGLDLVGKAGTFVYATSQAYVHVVKRLSGMIRLVENFKIAAASSQIPTLESNVQNFVTLTTNLEKIASKLQCHAKPKELSEYHISGGWVLVSTIICAIVILYRLLRPTRERAKLN